MKTTFGKSVYIHVPFCLKKCPYCHFYSVYPTKSLVKDFINSLIEEMKSHKLQKKNIVSLYFGGGSPSLLDPQDLEKIFKNISGSFLENIEITLEANPNQISYEKIKGIAEVGVNRISMGVQSFNKKELKTLGRDHTPKETIEAVYTILKAGIENISIDLMYDLPHQTKASFIDTLNTALSLPITHLSLYNLTFEENTSFTKNKAKLNPFLPCEEDSLFFLEKAIELFSKKGFKRYEISALSKEGFESKHNLGYWIGREFLGFGPSAFSYLNQKRYKNVSQLNKYIESIKNKISPVDFEEKLPFPDNLKELLSINLRLMKGVDLKEFQKKHGVFPKELENSLKQLISEDFLNKKNDQLYLSEKGTLFYDYIAENII